MYYGVIFSQCADGVALKYFNDYDNLFDGCWFENSPSQPVAPRSDAALFFSEGAHCRSVA